jgi:hypothetical protein
MRDLTVEAVLEGVERALARSRPELEPACA